MAITEVHKMKFRHACRILNEILADIRKTTPQANYYLADDSLHLMKGPSHDNSRDQRPLHENSMESVTIRGSGGGGW